MKSKIIKAISISILGSLLTGVCALSPAFASKGKILCSSIDDSISNCSFPTGRSTISGTLDPENLTGSVSITFVDGSSWPTYNSKVTSAKIIIPNGQVLTSVHINGSATTCSYAVEKKGTSQSIVALRSNAVNVNKLSCADGDVLVLDTQIAAGLTLENGTITNGIAVQYKTSDSRSTKSSIWRNAGDYTVGASNGLGDCAANSGGYVFDGPTSFPTDSGWTTITVDDSTHAAFTLDSANANSKYALFKVSLGTLGSSEAYAFHVDGFDAQLCILSPSKQFRAFQDDPPSGMFGNVNNLFPLIYLGGDGNIYGNLGSATPLAYTYVTGTYYFIVNRYNGFSSGGPVSGTAYVSKVSNPFIP